MFLFLSPSPHAALTTENVLRELKDVSWKTLSKGKRLSSGWYQHLGVLWLPASQRRKIEAEYSIEYQRKNAAIQYWLLSDPYASWKKLITRLDTFEEHTVAKQIHRFAEKPTGMTCTY